MGKEFVSLQKMQVVSWIYLAVLIVGSGIGFSWTVAWSVFAGGVVAIASFMISQRGLQRFFNALPSSLADDGADPGAVWTKSGYLLKFWIRIAIIGVVLLLLIKSGKVNIFGLILGLSTIVFAVTFTALNVVRHYYFSGRR